MKFSRLISFIGSRLCLLLLETLSLIFPKVLGLFLNSICFFNALKLFMLVLVGNLLHLIFPYFLQIVIVFYPLQLHTFSFSNVSFHLLLHACFNFSNHLLLYLCLLFEIELNLLPAFELTLHSYHLI